MNKKPFMLTKDMQQRQAEHRTALMYAMRALPSNEVLDLVAAGLVARNDYETESVNKFTNEVNTWAWEEARHKNNT